jgi:rhodanese-related sulfurtransferase
MINTMNVTELNQKLTAGENIILIDCREQNEWDEAHIAQARFIPLSNFAAELANFSDTPKDAIIVCQCRSGKRSLQAAMHLQNEGYENLFNLEGGILAWNEENFPTV